MCAIRLLQLLLGMYAAYETRAHAQVTATASESPPAPAAEPSPTKPSAPPVTAPPSPAETAKIWVVSTIDGSTYRAEHVDRQSSHLLRLRTVGGALIEIPSYRLARVWEDSETASMAPDEIVRTLCPGGQLAHPRIRQFVVRGEPAPFSARLTGMQPGHLIRIQRLDTDERQEWFWTDVEQVQRRDDQVDSCLLNSNPVRLPPAAPSHPPPVPPLSSKIMILVGALMMPSGLALGAGGLALGLGVPRLSCFNLDPNTERACVTFRFLGEFAGYAVAVAGPIVTLTGMGLLIAGRVKRGRAQKPQTALGLRRLLQPPG